MTPLSENAGQEPTQQLIDDVDLSSGHFQKTSQVYSLAVVSSILSISSSRFYRAPILSSFIARILLLPSHPFLNAYTNSNFKSPPTHQSTQLLASPPFVSVIRYPHHDPPTKMMILLVVYQRWRSYADLNEITGPEFEEESSRLKRQRQRKFD
ncbi:hypothetical protein CPB83DRAFT_903565 [Crepidotus variabilis]|uniref:Uncharacterized protein n=1 Tax=Crepidotus variabilis TaxID=179855 RepID=A0A9P6JU35_9AGAR|nr:hypothetical protein CPB83DRAFT_903565 [Crepidotus variabilis]